MNLPTGAMFPDWESIPEDARLAEPVEQREYLLGGALHRWDGPVREVLSPIRVRTRDGLRAHRVGTYPLMTAERAAEALAAARGAWDNGRGEWPTMPVNERIRRVGDFLERMLERRHEVVRLLMWEIGKSRRDSEREFDRTAEYIEQTIAAVKDLDRVSSRFVIEEGIIAQIRRAPLGVVLCMGPYNYPLNETFTTLIPALIMGNTVVFKPPRFGVLLHRPLLEAFRDAFPSGVVNTLYGEGGEIIGPLMESGGIDVLAFIGSSRVADLIRAQHPRPHRLRCVLGLDAKNAAIVLPDADLRLAVRECLLGSLSFNGQRCTAIKLIFVHRTMAEEFLARFCQELDALVAGMPWDADVDLTPLCEPGKPAYLAEMIGDALHHGARVLNSGGGAVIESYVHPAVLYPVDARMRVWREEQFGPIVPVAIFDDIEEPIRHVVESEYGQQISLFGTGAEALARLIDPLVNQVCRVNLNAQCQRGPDSFPFTGRKDSAEGTLSITDALRVFSIRTLVATREGDLNQGILTEILQRRLSGFLSTEFLF